MQDLITICNSSDDAIVIPAAGQYGSFVFRPGMATIPVKHWEAIQTLVHPMPDPLSLAMHRGTIAVAPAKPAKKAPEAEADTDPAMKMPELPPKKAPAKKAKPAAAKKKKAKAKK